MGKHLLVDTSYLLTLANSGQSFKKWVSTQVSQKNKVHITGEVLDEIKRYAKHPQVSKLIREFWECVAKKTIMYWEHVLDEGKINVYSNILKKASPKNNTRVGKGDASLFEVGKILEGPKQYLSTDSDVFLIEGFV